MSLRKITSLTALLSFTALAFTSVLTYLAPQKPGGWEALGLGKDEWFVVQTNLGALLLVAGVLHIALNIKPIIQCLKNRDGALRVFTLEFNIALALTGWILLSSIFDWPPVNALQKFKSERAAPREEPIAKEPADDPRVMPEKMPFFHGRRSLEKVCAEYEMDVVLIVRELRGLGVEAQADWSLKEIAKANEMETAAVYDVIRQLN